jgi:eukaryotic-like serine/threonine-protein kinase
MGGDLMAREWDVPGYTEVKALGSGGFGDVVLARHDASGTLVAIKYLRRHLLADPEFAELFRAEAAVLASLDDPNVVRLYEYAESPSGAAIVMELVDGVSLREILARQGQTTAEAALVVLQGSLLGLAAAHQRGVVHRDYKPENVLVNGEGASKLTDFGIAARAGDRAMAAGTLAYAPPEQFGGGPASPSGDVYAATATFYECLTGRPPFSGDTAERLMYQHLAEAVPLEPVPGPLRPLIEAGMAKDPGRRPADAAALVGELRTVAAGAYGPGWEERGRSGLAAAALLLAALWPAGAPPAVQGAAVHRVRLRHHLAHGHAGAAKVAVAVGVVIAGGAIASAVVLAGSTGHAARPPAPTATPARATTQAPAPAQLTGTQLASALLPISDFPAGYGAFFSGNSGPGVAPESGILYKATCGHGPATGLLTAVGGIFDPQLDSAYAEHSYMKPYSPNGGSLFLSQAVYQFSDPAEAVAFFSSVHTCLIDKEAWSNDVDPGPVNGDVDTATVNGDKAVTANFRSVANGASHATEVLYVLHGTDVFALSADSYLGPDTVTNLSIPGAAELIAKLIARVDALSPATSPAPSPATSPASSAVASPSLPPQQQAAQALAALLAQSGTDRTAVTQAVGAVADCSPNLSQDETIFNNAASSHQALLGNLAALPDRSALPASMLQDLTAAWQESIEADQDFARWTQDEISHGCSTNYQSDANYQAVSVPDDAATTDKKAFAALWTAIADEYGLPSYQYNQI